LPFTLLFGIVGAMTSALRVATYHRVSTLDRNPALAREELRAAASRLGELVMEVEEKGSGATNDRPGLQRVLAEARKGAVDVVVVYKLDRFGRSTLDLLANVKQLVETCGVRFVAVSQGLDVRPGGDAMSRLLLTVLGAVAEFERDLIRDRTRLGLAAAKRRGIRLGRPAAMHDRDAAKVKRLRANGASWSAVASLVGCTVASARRAAAR
jgi:putative DNA-invertase from lambdoid prophage Rac